MEAKHKTKKEFQTGPQMDPKWEPKWSKIGARRGFRKWSKNRCPSGRAKGEILVTVSRFWKVRPLRKGRLLEPFWEAFGTPSGPERGLEKHFKNSSNNDSILEPILGAFWGHVGAQIGSIKVHIKPEGSKRPQKGLLKHESIEICDVL